MAMTPVIKVLFVIGGLLSIAFLSIGIYAPVWMKYKITTYYSYFSPTTSTISIGLWRVQACKNNDCASVSMNVLAQAIEDSNQSTASKNAGTDLLKSFLPMQVLCAFGGIAAIVGPSLVFRYIKQLPTGVGNKQMAVAGVICNMISGALVMSAVAVQTGRNQSFKEEVDTLMKIPEVKKEIEIEVLYPWAMLVAGIGAGLIFVLGLVFGIAVCVYRNDESDHRPTAAVATTDTSNQSPYALYNMDAN